LKPLCFLIEHENPTKALRLPLEAGPAERLRFMAHFWCSDTEPHVLKVFAQRPDLTVCTVATLTEACNKAPGVLVMRGSLDPLVAAGWQRLHLDLDGVLIGQSRPIFILGPRPNRPSRYMGRDEPLPPSKPRGSALPDTTADLPSAVGSYRPKRSG
jgi:hypothetical protein